MACNRSLLYPLASYVLTTSYNSPLLCPLASCVLGVASCHAGGSRGRGVRAAASFAHFGPRTHGHRQDTPTGTWNHQIFLKGKTENRRQTYDTHCDESTSPPSQRFKFLQLLILAVYVSLCLCVYVRVCAFSD